MNPLTWNADIEPAGNGLQRARIGVKWRNFLSPSGWRPIDLGIRQAGGLFSISQAPYALDVPTLANDWSIIQSTNRWDIWKKLAMTDQPCGIQKRYPTAAPVAGAIAEGDLLFPLAFPDLGADRLVEVHEQEVRDLVVFRSAPPGSGDIEVPLEIDFGTLPILASTGRGKPAQERDFRGDRTISQGLSFTTGRFRGLKIKAPRVWDSAGYSAPIAIVGRVIGTRFVGKKLISRSFFERAVFPVFTDTTSTFYPDPDPESTSVDGVVRYDAPGSPNNESFSTVHDASGAGSTSADDSSSILTQAVYIQAADVGEDDLWDTIAREIVLFDTSAIGSGVTVNSANFSQYVFNVTDDFSDGLDLVSSNPASNTALSGSDYGSLGTTPYMTRASLSGLTASARNTWAMNGSGLSAIDVNGITKLGMRAGYDTDNISPTWSATLKTDVGFKFAESSGTTSDPELDVTYSPASSLLPTPEVIKRQRELGVHAPFYNQ